MLQEPLMRWYDSFAENRYSQYGEDGILEEVFRRCGIEKGFFVEFGAWDGLRHSNTYNLMVGHGWRGIYIEADPKRFEALKQNVPQDDVIKLCERVAPSGTSSLDAILARHQIQDNIHLLSIDIDSDDYAVWASLERYNPLVVVVEHNPTIPLEVDYVQGTGRNVGNSARALFRIGKSKGYVGIAMTVTNLIFIRQDFFSRLKIEAPSLERLAGEDTTFRIFYGYDGSLVHVGPQRFTGNPWQKKVPAQIPWMFRYYGAKGPVIDFVKTIVLRLIQKLIG
jgi:hypothetical protein